MKHQSAKVQQLKGKIASLINFVKLGIKKYIVQLLDLETELAIALSRQIKVGKKVSINIMQIPQEYRKPYHQLAQALSSLSGLNVDQIFVKVENVQTSPFLPEINEYSVWGASTYSEDEVNANFPKTEEYANPSDALASWDGTIQGYAH